MTDEEIIEAIAAMQLSEDEDTEDLGNLLMALFERQIQHMHMGNRMPGFTPKED